MPHSFQEWVIRGQSDSKGGRQILSNFLLRCSFLSPLSCRYPTLGTRFVHTSEGKFLVTRLVPCPVCLECHGQHEGPGNHPQARHLPDNWGSFVEMNPLYCSMTASQISQVSHDSPSVV